MGILSNGILAIAFSLSFTSVLHAQESKLLSLTEAVGMGLENSKQLKVALSESKEAAFKVEEKKRIVAPDIDLSGRYMTVNTPNISMGTALTGDNSGSDAGGSGIAPKYVMFGTATAKISLFSGLKIQNDIQSAKYLGNAARLDAENQKSEVILNLISAYVNLYKAQETVKLVKEDLQEAHKRVKDFTRMKDNGVLALNDVLKAQLQESNTSLALLDAQNSQRVANYNMNLMLGLDEKTQLTLDSINVDQPETLLSMSDLHNTALTKRKDLQAIEEREKASETAIKIAKGTYLPSIGLSGGYVAADIDQVVTISNAWNVGLGVSFNLGELYKNGSHVSQAEEKYAQTRLKHEQVTDQVKSEVFHSFSNYQESLQRINVYKKAEQQAKENYRIVKDKHNNSLATTTDLLDADVDQLQAELNLRFSEADVLLAYCKLLEVSGQLDVSAIQTLTAN